MMEAALKTCGGGGAAAGTTKSSSPAMVAEMETAERRGALTAILGTPLLEREPRRAALTAALQETAAEDAMADILTLFEETG